MSREQRRLNRRQQARGAAPPVRTPSAARRTPVRAPASGGIPWVPIGVVGGIVVVVALIAYLIVQSTGGDDGQPAHVRAEQDASTDLPGVFHPTQGRGHFNYTYSPGRTPRPFCEGVPKAEGADPQSTPGGTTTPGASSTPNASATPQTAVIGDSGSSTPQATPTQRTDCYNSNPPSSGQHLNVQNDVDVGNGALIDIPGASEVLPPDVVFPREAIPHFLEHAGVFVGYHCSDSDTQCREVVDDLEGLVNDRIDNHGDRVMMSNDPDLPEGEIGLSSWTRVLNVKASDYDRDTVEDFVSAHECRFDPEGFCR